MCITIYYWIGCFWMPLVYAEASKQEDLPRFAEWCGTNYWLSSEAGDNGKQQNEGDLFPCPFRSMHKMQKRLPTGQCSTRCSPDAIRPLQRCISLSTWMLLHKPSQMPRKKSVEEGRNNSKTKDETCQTGTNDEACWREQYWTWKKNIW